MMALLANIALLSPLLGPLVGTLLLEWVSWRWLFVSLGGAAVLAWFALYRFMPETLGVDRRDGTRLEFQPIHLLPLLAGYAQLLGNRRFVAGSAALGLIGLPLIGWIGLSPVLLIHDEGLSTMEYALWQLPVFGGLILGNLIINRIADRYPLTRLVQGALWPFLSGLLLAMLGMITIALLGFGGAVMAMVGAGAGLLEFALAAGLAGLLALWPLWLVLRDSRAALAVQP